MRYRIVTLDGKSSYVQVPYMDDPHPPQSREKVTPEQAGDDALVYAYAVHHPGISTAAKSSSSRVRWTDRIF